MDRIYGQFILSWMVFIDAFSSLEWAEIAIIDDCVVFFAQTLYFDFVGRELIVAEVQIKCRINITLDEKVASLNP